MGIALKDIGKLNSNRGFYQSDRNNPNYAKAWNNIYFPIRALKGKMSNRQDSISSYLDDVNLKKSKIRHSMLQYKLNLGQIKVANYLDQVLKDLSSAENLVIQNPQSVNINNQQSKELLKKGNTCSLRKKRYWVIA